MTKVIKKDSTEGKWAVVVSLLLREEKKEGDETKADLIVRDYVTVIKSPTRRGAVWSAVETLWEESQKLKELRPVCGAQAIPLDVYLDAQEKMKQQLAVEPPPAAKEEDSPVPEIEGEQSPELIAFPQKENADGIPTE